MLTLFFVIAPRFIIELFLIFPAPCLTPSCMLLYYSNSSLIVSSLRSISIPHNDARYKITKSNMQLKISKSSVPLRGSSSVSIRINARVTVTPCSLSLTPHLHMSLTLLWIGMSHLAAYAWCTSSCMFLLVQACSSMFFSSSYTFIASYSFSDMESKVEMHIGSIVLFSLLSNLTAFFIDFVFDIFGIISSIFSLWFSLLPYSRPCVCFRYETLRHMI